MKLCANKQCRYNSIKLLPPLDKAPHVDIVHKDSVSVERITRYLYSDGTIGYYLCEQCHLDSVKQHKKHSK